MKKIIALVLCAFAVADFGTAFGAVKTLAPKKAAPVAKKETSVSSSIGASLLPTALSMVNAGITLSKQQRELSAECEPTQREITFVNNLVKEWAIAGATNPMGKSGWVTCAAGRHYKDSIKDAYEYGETDTSKICFDVYDQKEARGAVWAGFPKADIATYCADGSTSCKGNSQKKMSNLWEIYQLIGWQDADFIGSESSEATKLNERIAKCAPAKLNARKTEAMGGFIKDTVSNIGKPMGTETIMESVQGILSQSGSGFAGTLGGLTNVAGQLMAK